MSKAAVIVSRNDNYGDGLHLRAKLCLDQARKVFDKIIYVDWKCVNGETLLEAMNYFHGPEIEVIKIPKEFIEQNLPHLINFPIVESIGRNVGVRKAIDIGIDFICSTNIDVI